MDVQRRAIRVRGIVQGVGFRPAMFRLADSLELAGFVYNDREGVWIEVEGSVHDLQIFVAGLPAAAPPASRIDAIEIREVAPLLERGFRIAQSPSPIAGPRAAAAVPADLAPCADCVRELSDPADRRYRYPFTNCTACGPRFTIVREVPYDRGKTTMDPFVMCPSCRREYEDPADRRFHAEPNACPVCGPRLRLLGPEGHSLASGDVALRAAAAAIADGRIVAVKGAGGFVLAADACSEAAVARLRSRKRRPDKPLAVMVRSVDDLDQIAIIDPSALVLVASPARPIVLVPMRPGVLASSIAPGLTDIGIYLPPTPLQHLLLADGPRYQVMTSGNLVDEPIARTDDDALARLGDVADLFLVHDREIHSRADDSVLRATSAGAIPMRRSRGHVPDAIRLPVAGPPLLAVGGHERNTVCLVRDGEAVVSAHVGDLEHPEAEAFFRETIAHLQDLLGAAPEAIAHDLHPDYRSTRWAMSSALPRVAIQHHHAHVAACLAEHGRDDRVIGVAFDGTGFGDDGGVWGGEILDADLGTSTRRGHLWPIALAGGEMAIRQPWRLAAAALIDAGESLDLLPWVPARERGGVRELLATDLPVRATGAGRWFDAVAVLLRAADAVSYDGQAAAQLEALAVPGPATPFEIAIIPGDPFSIDLRPAIRELARELRRTTPPPILAARFHATLESAIAAACRRLDVPRVVLTGGCFQNRRLLDGARRSLERDGFEVLVHRRVPPNDGGLALGQAAIASWRLAQRSRPCA